MEQVPLELGDRQRQYCLAKGHHVQQIIGYGIDGYVWRTDQDSVLKVHRYRLGFEVELAVYQRLTKLGLWRLQGFTIPKLLDYAADLYVLELTFVAPPFILDFAAVRLDGPPLGFDPEDHSWIAEKKRMFGSDWPDVQRLLNGLLQYGVYFPDVHLGNVRVRR